MIRDKDGTKWLTAKRLAELLETLPPDSRVMPNTVGNLLVLSPDGLRSIAFVDFVGAGEVESME
ncbi:MAG: hypothetical protein WC023_01380 [Rhodocyclaceae bacterium]